MGANPITAGLVAGATSGRSSSSGRGRSTIDPTSANTDQVSRDIQKNLERFSQHLSGAPIANEDVAFGVQALRDFSRSGPNTASDALARGLIDQDEFDFLQTSATGATDEDKLKALGNVYRKVVGKAAPGKRGTLSGADTDAALLSVRRGRELREAKKDAPGLRAQTLLGTRGNLNAPGTPQGRTDDEFFKKEGER